MQTTTLKEMGMYNPLIKPGSKLYHFAKDQCYKTRNDPNRGSWKHFDKGSPKIVYSSIPADHKQRLNLPEDINEYRRLLTERLKAAKSSHPDTVTSQSFHLAGEIDKCIQPSNYVKYISGYAAENKNNFPIAERYSQEQALREAIIKLHKDGYSKKELHVAYLHFSKEGTQRNYTKFTVKINNDWTTSEGIRLGNHGNAGRKRDDLKKVDERVAAWIEDYYKHPNQYPHNMIAELVSAACKGAGKEGICRETVTEYVNRPENKNRLMMYRNPEQFRKVNQPRLRRLKAENPCDLAYGDGTPLQIPCWNKKGDKLVRLQLYVILDQCSGFIGGFSLSETEDRYSILGAMEMFVSMTGYLPHTYKHDNASGNNAEEWLQFRMKALIAGCNAEPCKPGEPTAKADIERFFGTFQSYQRMVNGFIGEGVRSKRDTGRVDIDFLKAYHKKEGYYSYETMVEVVTRLINAYNQTETARKEAPSAIFARNKPNGIRVSTEQKAFLFWPYKTIKVMQSEVVFKIRHAVYIYKVYDHETALLLNGKQVRVYYQESDLSEVCLFDEHDQYITSIKQKVLVHAAPVNQTDGDVQQIIKQTAHNHSIKTFVKSETKKISDNLTDDPDIILTSPLTHTKEKFDNAETDHMLDYMRDRYSIDRNNVSEFETVETVDSSNDVRTRYSKKHTPKKPSLAILD